FHPLLSLYLSLSSLFLQFTPSPLDLPSFPTRRSSDLVIGYVVPFGIPEVVRHINAFTLGAQATHPGAKVKLVWTNAWYSPPKETDRKSTRLNSSHGSISYAVFCLKKKKNTQRH